MIKMIVSDMDGTLLSENEKIDQGNVEAIKQAIDEGKEFVIASGRSYSGVKHIMDEYGIVASMILGNGAQYVDKNGNLKMTEYFPKERLQLVSNVFFNLSIHFMIFVENDHYYSLEDPLLVRDAFLLRCCHRFGHDYQEMLDDPLKMYPCKHLVKTTIKELIDNPLSIIKVEAFDTDVSKIERAKVALKDIEGISFLSSFDDNVEVTKDKAQKGFILEEIIQSKHIKKEEVIVLGDGFNDMSLFDLFPYSYAPSNSEQLIKDKAYKVVGDHKNNAVKEAIEDAKEL